MDGGPVSAVPADGQVVDPDRPHPRLRQVRRGLLGDVNEILHEAAAVPAPGRVRCPEQDAFPGLQPVPADLADRDLAGMLDLDHPGLAHRRGQRHLIQPGRPGQEVHRPVHVGAGVHPHRQAGDVAVVAAAQVHHPFQHDRRIVRPVRHAVPDRHRHVYPVRHLRHHNCPRDIVLVRHPRRDPCPRRGHALPSGETTVGDHATGTSLHAARSRPPCSDVSLHSRSLSPGHSPRQTVQDTGGREEPAGAGW